MALFLTGQEPQLTPLEHQKYIRKGYITLKVKASLKTKFDTTRPVTITDKYHREIIRNVFIIEKIVSQHDDLLDPVKSQYIIEIKQNDFQKLSRMGEKFIYPYQLKFPKVTRSSYEILF